MRYVLTVLLVCGLLGFGLAADAKRIQHDINKKVMNAEKSLENEALNHKTRTPAELTHKDVKKRPISPLLEKVTVLHPDQDKKAVDCSVQFLGSAYFGKQCTGRLLSF